MKDLTVGGATISKLATRWRYSDLNTCALSRSLTDRQREAAHLICARYGNIIIGVVRTRLLQQET